MKRICAALALWFCAAVPAFAQDRAQLPLVGLLRINTPATLGPTSAPLREALAALGDVDGSTRRCRWQHHPPRFPPRGGRRRAVPRVGGGAGPGPAERYRRLWRGGRARGA